jgi:hypothetical protein
MVALATYLTNLTSRSENVSSIMITKWGRALGACPLAERCEGDPDEI